MSGYRKLASSERSNLERQHLIESHLPLVRAVARRYAGHGEALDDLIQVGAIGLIKSSDRFDPRRGVAFATFATPAIEGEIRRHLGDRASSLRIPRALRRLSAELRVRRGELAAALGRSPTVRELATALETDERQVEAALTAEQARNSIPLGDDALERTESSELTGSDDRLALARGMLSLDERERQIVFLRFHADMTESEIGRVLGISQTHVSRVLSGALIQLREELVSSSDVHAEGDIATGEVISPPSKPLQAHVQRDDRGRTDVPDETRIAGVLGSQPNREHAQDLELPYDVVVKRKRAGDRSWWSATVEELGLEVQGSTPEEAVHRLQPAINALLSTALDRQRQAHEPSPPASKPKTGSSHSGRFLVRMPSTLHDQLARAAEREDVSLNRFVTDVLSSAVAPTPTMQSPPAAGQPPVARSAPPAESAPPNQPILPEGSAAPGSRSFTDPSSTQATSGSTPPTGPGSSTTHTGSTSATAARSTAEDVATVTSEAVAVSTAAVPMASEEPTSSAWRPAARSHRQSGRTAQLALAANLFVIVFAGAVAIVLLVLALQRGI